MHVALQPAMSVSPSGSLSVFWSVGHFFGIYKRLIHNCFCQNVWVSLFYYCLSPLARDFGSLVSGLVMLLPNNRITLLFQITSSIACFYCDFFSKCGINNYRDYTVVKFKFQFILTHLIKVQNPIWIFFFFKQRNFWS